MPDREDGIILCGGLGTRLRPVSDGAPKSLMTVSGRPFLELLLGQLLRYGFDRVILATGYGATEIRSRLGDTFGGLNLVYSVEEVPLGTGGALRHAARHVRTTNCLVMNGDSYTGVDLAGLIRAHVETLAQVSLVVVPSDERGDSGSIAVDDSGRVLQFMEKGGHNAQRYTNAGIYALRSPLLFDIPSDVPISLEREVFPTWIQTGVFMKAHFHRGQCVDIGTPERYETAQFSLADVERQAHRTDYGTRL